MAKRSDFIGLAALTIIFSYALAVGATFNGILFPEFHNMTLGLMTLVVVFWLLMHWRGGWRWYRTSLDTVFLLWFLAFGVSLVANNDAWRRIDIGLWYVGVYIGAWYVLHDLIANRALKCEVIVDALLIAGFVIVMLGFVQLQVWLRQVLSTGQFIAPPRPVSVFGNPNFLSSFLIVLTPLTLSRVLSVRGKPPRILLGIYAFLQIVLLLLTNSRGAWIGAVFGLALWGILAVSRNGQLTASSVRTWWQRQSNVAKSVLVSFLVVGIIAVGTLSIVIVRSLSDPGREAGLRLDIYTAAIELFKEKPLTGQGLFTFGRGLVRLPGIHPDKPHSHAHDVPLHIAAELGLLGLAALAVTLVVGYRTMHANWQASTARERLMLAGAIGAVMAFAVHQLTDIPAMMPAIALTGLVALVLALAPKEPELVNVTWARTGHPIEMVGIWVVVVITGFWNSGIYSNYVAVLTDAAKTGNYQQDAERMNTVIAADPQLSLYYLQQGFLYGMAGNEGDWDAIKAGIMAYDRFIQLDPGYALAWANRGALKGQFGDLADAMADLRQAIKLDSTEWNFQFLMGRYAGALGQSDVLEAAYREALRLYPDASLHRELSAFVGMYPDAVDPTKLTVTARTVQLMQQGDVNGALAAWQGTPLDNAPAYVVQALLAIAQHDQDGAATALAKAEKLTISPVEQAWVHVGKARLARLIGNSALVADEVKAAEEALKTDPLASDDDTLINIAYAQFLQVAIERQYLPQVNYRRDPVLLYLLANT